MDRIKTAPLPLGALTVHRAVSAASDLYDRVGRWRRIRQTARVLAALEDHQLDDLGLSRGDIDRYAKGGRL